MKIKEEIEKLLNELKTHGISRRKIEMDMNYKENYIDQVVSKGGNERFLKALKSYKNRILQKAIPEPNEVSEHTPYYSRDNADLHSLIMSNVTLSQAQMKLAETNAELTGMLKAVLPVTATDKKEMIEVLNTNMRGLLDAIADVAMGKKFPSKQAALMELSKTVHASHKKVKEAGSLTSSHK